MAQTLIDLGVPVTFSALVVEITSRCNARCGMCYQAAGPKGSDIIGDQHLRVETVVSLAESATSLPEVGRRFHVSGGESYLDSDKLLEIFRAVHHLGHFVEISTTTNAYWAATRKRADQIASASSKAGLTMMEISWDHWHGPFVSAHAVSNCIDACVENGIEPHLRILTAKDNSAQKALDLLRLQSLRRVTNIHIAPVFSTGRAVKELDPSTFHFSAEGPVSIGGSCHSALNLTINAKGNAFPCCAGADQTEGLAFGNVLQMPLVTIVKRMQASPLLRVLVFNGVSVFYPLLLQAGISLKPIYRNMCEFCYDVFSKPEATAVVRQYCDEATEQAIGAGLRQATNSPMSAWGCRTPMCHCSKFELLRRN
jgi:organic radical activating enzyme